jgi:hypothetical protein
MPNTNPFNALCNDDNEEEDLVDGWSDGSSSSSKSSSSPSIPGKLTNKAASKCSKPRRTKKPKSNVTMDETPKTWVDTEIVIVAHEPGVPLEGR